MCGDEAVPKIFKGDKLTIVLDCKRVYIDLITLVCDIYFLYDNSIYFSLLSAVYFTFIECSMKINIFSSKMYSALHYTSEICIISCAGY